MKKIVSLLLICSIFLNAQSCFAEELKAKASMSIPKWEDFCPGEYINAEYRPGIKGKLKNFTWHEEIFAVTLIGFPIAMLMYNARQEYNYWTSRKYSFENNLKICLDNPGDKAMCLMQIVQLEQSKDSQKQQYQIGQRIIYQTRQINNKL